MSHKEKGITAIGLNYLDSIIFEFLKKSFDVYVTKDFSKRQYQVSIYENKHATAGIVLLAIGIESYRNLIFYGEKEKINRNSVGDDLAKIFNKKNKNIPVDYIRRSVIEIHVLRDIIVHSHVYKVFRELDSNWDVKLQRLTLLKDQYGDKKLMAHSNSKTKKTHLLKLNIRPIRIGFEDYFKTLIILDLLIGIIDKYWSKNIVGYHPLFQIDGESFTNLSELYAYFYDNIPNKPFKKSLRKILNDIRKSFSQYMDYSDSFIGNICFNCGEFGFKKRNNVYQCSECGDKVEFTNSTTISHQGPNR